MKPMIYRAAPNYLRELLACDTYRGFEYYVMSLGVHPCAYVAIPSSHEFYQKHYDELPNIDCHGGLTYSNSFLCMSGDKGINGWFIGWDYAHFNDYSGIYSTSIFPDYELKRWTTEEIVAECKHVIDQLADYGDEIEEDKQ